MSETFVLVILYALGGAGGMTTVTFQTQEACHRAMVEVKQRPFYATRTMCLSTLTGQRVR